MKIPIRLLALFLSSISNPALAVDSETTSAPSPDESVTSAWAANQMTLVRKGRKLDRGFALYTTSDQVPGIAFRCHRQKMYAFVSVRPVSFRKLLTDRFRNPAEWQVEYRVDGGEPKMESWIWTYGGKVFMSPPGPSVNDLFHAARRGGTIDFQRKHGDPVTIEVPPGDVDRFDQFIEKCGVALTDPGAGT